MPRKTQKLIPLKDINVAEHSFMAMEPKKREQFIAACWNEFAKGFDKANTDIITQNAGVSKGLLYYHFKSKENLFLFLIRYCVDIITEEFQKADITSKDYLEVVRSLGLVSIKLTKTRYEIYQFLIPAINYTKEHIPDALNGFVVPTDKILHEALTNYDPFLFKEGLDIPKACNIIQWALKGYSDLLSEQAKVSFDYDEIYRQTPQEFDEYLRMLRVCFYKEEFV